MLIVERFLIEGLDHDDAWIMVEDEFYAVAQSFTQHLHYAEYLRRKKEAKAQGADAIRELERPTDGRTTIPGNLQRRKDAEALAARQKAGLEQISGHEDKDGDEDEDEDETDTWAGTHLQGFITSPRKMRSLLSAHGLKSSTRAAAGFGQAAGTADGKGLSGSQSALPSRAASAQVPAVDEETASEDDDLDGLEQSTILSPTRHQELSTPIRNLCSNNRKPGESPSTSKEKARPPRRSQPADGFKSRVQSLFDDLDELPEPSQSTAISDPEQTPKAPPRKENLEGKNSRLNDVPTFWM